MIIVPYYCEYIITTIIITMVHHKHAQVDVRSLHRTALFLISTLLCYNLYFQLYIYIYTLLTNCPYLSPEYFKQVFIACVIGWHKSFGVSQRQPHQFLYSLFFSSAALMWIMLFLLLVRPSRFLIRTCS